jgi:hypothetical protein
MKARDKGGARHEQPPSSQGLTAKDNTNTANLTSTKPRRGKQYATKEQSAPKRRHDPLSSQNWKSFPLLVRTSYDAEKIKETTRTKGRRKKGTAPHPTNQRNRRTEKAKLGINPSRTTTGLKVHNKSRFRATGKNHRLSPPHGRRAASIEDTTEKT